MLKIVIYQNKGLITVGWGTGVEANLKLRNVEYPLYILLLTIRWFYLYNVELRIGHAIQSQLQYLVLGVVEPCPLICAVRKCQDCWLVRLEITTSLPLDWFLAEGDTVQGVFSVFLHR